MNKKKFFKAFGLAMVAAAAFGITACDDSSSSPVNVDQFAEGDLSSGNDTLSSAQPTSSETAQPTSSENAQPASSGSNPASSGAKGESSSSVTVCRHITDVNCIVTCDASVDTEALDCATGKEFKCTDGHWDYKSGGISVLAANCYAGPDTLRSSSSVAPNSSSAINSNSSSSKENCLHMPHFADSLHITYQVPVCTAEEEGTRLPDCETSDVYVCENGSWNTIADETCRHITDTGDPMKPHPCTVEFDVAMDCVKNYYMMCANGIWLNATGCDTTKEKCGFDDYKLCIDYQLRAYCSDDWLNEPCEEGRTRDLRIYDTTDSTSFSYVNYICVEGKWVKRSSLYSNCDNDKDCLGGFQQCWQSEIIGQACNERDPKTSWVTEGRCDYVCRDGKYEFMPPPQG